MFVVDETDDTNFDLLQKLMYNIARLFKPGQSKFTTVAFGTKARTVAAGATYGKVKQIQDSVVKVHPRANKRLYVGRALRYVRYRILRKLSKAVPRVVITIMQGSSNDNFRVMRGVLIGANVKLISIGELFVVYESFTSNLYSFLTYYPKI